MADYATKQFFGTAQTVYDSASAISAGNFSAASSLYSNITDSAVPYATHAVAMLEVIYGSPPAVGTVVELWAMRQNVDSTDDEANPPSGTDSNAAQFIKAFVLDNVATQQRKEITVDMLGIRECLFYLKNGAASSTGTSPNTVLKVTPLSLGVTAA